MKKFLPLVIIAAIILTGCKKEKNPVASFSITKSNYYLGEQVSLSNTSTNATSYQWDFGDGQSSTEQNPQHTFAKQGNYQIKLTSNGNSSTVHVIKVYLGTASYEADNNSSIAAPLVSFATDANNNIIDFIDHGMVAVNGKSDTVFTNNASIYLGGKIGTKTFVVTTPYPITKNTHNKVALLNTSLIYVSDNSITKPALQNVLIKKLNKQTLKSIE